MNVNNIYRRMPVIVAAVIVLLGAVGLVRRCTTAGPRVGYEYRRPGGDTLAVAIEMSPLTYTLHNDTVEGFDYQILRDITSAHGMAVRFYPVAQLDRAFADLYHHKYDLLVASMPSTSALKEYFPLTDAVYLDKQVLVQRRDSTGRGAVTSQEQLLGDTVWVAEGSPGMTRLRNMSRELGDTIFIMSEPRYSAEHLAILTALGEVRQSVVNEGIARHIAADYPDLDIDTPISFNQFQVWAAAPGDSALVDSLNTWLTQFKLTPQYRALSHRYLDD